MKNRKNRHSKTTFTSFIADMTRWYGPNWLKGGLLFAFFLFICPILVNFFA